MCPVGNAVHVIAVFASHKKLLYNAVFNLEAPVVCVVLVLSQIVASVLVFSDKMRIAHKEVSLADIGVFKQILCNKGRGDVVCLVVKVVFYEFNIWILVFKLVELLPQISSYEDDFRNFGFFDGVKESFNYHLSVNSNQWLWGVECYRNHS